MTRQRSCSIYRAHGQRLVSAQKVQMSRIATREDVRAQLIANVMAVVPDPEKWVRIAAQTERYIFGEQPTIAADNVTDMVR